MVELQNQLEALQSEADKCDDPCQKEKLMALTASLEEEIAALPSVSVVDQEMCRCLSISEYLLANTRRNLSTPELGGLLTALLLPAVQMSSPLVREQGTTLAADRHHIPAFPPMQWLTIGYIDVLKAVFTCVPPRILV